MGTRSAIGIEHQNGKIEAVYCHWDGYLSWNGQMLSDHYDREKTLALVALGDLSSLKSEIGERHDFEDRSDTVRNWCKFYGRDRGETGIESKSFNDIDDFVLNFNSGAEYHYVLRLSGIWQVSIHKAEFMDLFDAVREDAETEEY